MSPRKIGFLFGAGASFGDEDVQFKNYDGTIVVKTPPLGRYLYKKIKEESAFSSKIPDCIDRIFSKYETQDNCFEPAMEEVEKEYSEYICEIQFIISEYLSRFSPGENSTYKKLLCALKNTNKEYHFINLNYDIIFDTALFDFMGYNKNTLRRLDQYAISKPHGSCNFFPKTNGNIVKEFKFGDIMESSQYFESDIYATLNNDFFHEYFRNFQQMHPAICGYSPTKRDYSYKKSMKIARERARISMEESNVIFVIGCAYQKHDEHIWNYILDAKKRIYIVSPDADNSLEKIFTHNSDFPSAIITAIKQKFGEFVPTLPLLMTQLGRNQT